MKEQPSCWCCLQQAASVNSSTYQVGSWTVNSPRATRGNARPAATRARAAPTSNTVNDLKEPLAELPDTSFTVRWVCETDGAPTPTIILRGRFFGPINKCGVQHKSLPTRQPCRRSSVNNVMPYSGGAYSSSPVITLSSQQQCASVKKLTNPPLAVGL